MDEGFDYKKFMDDLAKDSVDQELTRHPEQIHQKDMLLKKKQEELEHKLEERNSKTYEELQRAGVILIQWIQTLPADQKERVTKEIVKINEKILSDDQILKKFLAGEFNLQKG